MSDLLAQMAGALASGDAQVDELQRELLLQ